MNQLIFRVTQETDGALVAECLTGRILTKAETWEELRQNVKESVSKFYLDQPQRPTSIRLHLVRDEILTTV